MKRCIVPDNDEMMVRVLTFEFTQKCQCMAGSYIIPAQQMKTLSFNGVDGTEEIAVDELFLSTDEFLLIGYLNPISHF